MTRTTSLRRLALCALTLGAPTSAAAQAMAPNCDTPQHRQFDFWIGEWDVFNPQGQRVGTNTITAVLGGCALHEQWESAGPSRGNSYNAYDRGSGRWHQTWVDNAGSVLRLDGGLEDDAMVLSGTTRLPTDTVRLDRITWTPAADGSVRQLWEQSADGGSTWRVAFDGRYVRR